MHDHEIFTYMKTEVEGKPEFTHGLIGNGSTELKTAQNLISKLGDSRFSVIAFAQYLADASATAAEVDKIMLSFLYYVQAQAEYDDRPHVDLARRLMDALDHYGYLALDFKHGDQ